MRNNKLVLSFKHIAEIYLYEYYFGNEYEISNEDKTVNYMQRAKEYIDEGNFDKALEQCINANIENPVDVFIIDRLIYCLKMIGDKESVLKYTKDSHKFRATRLELANYYRHLGWYYLENYNPDLSIALYKYSKMYYESKDADREINFLEEALKKDYSKITTEQVKTKLIENNIPLDADSVTLALLLKASEEATSLGMIDQAKDCLYMIYDLTNDSEIANRINNLPS